MYILGCIARTRCIDAAFGLLLYYEFIAQLKGSVQIVDNYENVEIEKNAFEV